MRRSLPLAGLIVFSLLLGCASRHTPRPVSGRSESPNRGGAAATNADRTAVLLAINDVYRIEGLDGGAAGGLARVRSLRRELEREHPDLLVLHAGDLLFPSFASRMYKGEQMIAVLNDLDGDPAAFDPRMFVTLGNHEFEKTKLAEASVLDARLLEAQFHWFGGNITFKTGADGKPLIAAPNLSRTALVTSGGLRIGLFGLTIPMTSVEYVADFAGPEATARELTAQLRAQGAEVVVALTHLNFGEDRQILEKLGDAGPDLIIGGHDHEAMAIHVGGNGEKGGRWILKADADARTATVVHLTKRADGRLEVAHELRPLAGDTPRPDPQVQALVDQWQARHEKEFCVQAQAAPGCLEEVYGHTTTPLEAEETKIRGRETSLGDWVADEMLAAFRRCGAHLAFLNSGSLRLNHDLPAGTTITRRHVEELFAYPTPLYLVKIDGATLQQVAEQSTHGWPGSGSWLQIGGFAFRHDTSARTARDLTWITGRGPRTVLPTDTFLAVTGDYLINPDAGDQDGYVMLSRDQIVKECPENGVDLKQLVVRDLQAAEPQGIAPVAEGRICQGPPGEPCLALEQR
jgi:2',3'-cyclic-nucleotide 2'-phosphodiesterase (5'-nucleotidase family)